MIQEEPIFFEDLALSDDVLDALYDMRFEKCTPVQARCIPPILEGRDVIGIAQTGTGKTAAYLLPLLTLLKQESYPKAAVNCLVMAPTRELAQQIDQALQGFGYYVDVNGVAVYGGNDGVRYEQERKSLKRGADIVIATPGRLLTHLDLGTFDLSRTTHLVLDEADRMLDMGFSDDILKIVKHLPEQRQTILFSATMPAKIRELAHKIMHNPEEVSIAISKPAENIRQSLFICKENDKTAIIKHLFADQKPERVIIFCGSKQKVKELNITLKRKGYNVEAMHSDLEQKQRDEVMLGFKAGRIDILVATDIVARGIDIDDITLVINYDVPRDAEDYVHRIGRTARAGRNGRAVTLVGEKDRYALRNIEQLLGKELPREALPEGLTPPEKSTATSGERRGSAHRRSASGKQREQHDHKRRDKRKPAGVKHNDGEGQKQKPVSAQGERPTEQTNKRRRRPNRSRPRPKAKEDAPKRVTPPPIPPLPKP